MEIGSGIPISGIKIDGKIVLTSEKAVEWSRQGIRCILVRRDTSPDDLHGMIHSVGILTARGGFTSHAALVAREYNKNCVVGCRNLKIAIDNKSVKFGDVILKEGDEITIDGETGKVFNFSEDGE